MHICTKCGKETKYDELWMDNGKEVCEQCNTSAVYELSREDIHNEAMQTIGRSLSNKEMTAVRRTIDDFFYDWDEHVYNCIEQVLKEIEEAKENKEVQDASSEGNDS